MELGNLVSTRPGLSALRRRARESPRDIVLDGVELSYSAADLFAEVEALTVVLRSKNIGLLYVWGADIDNELETSLALQVRYRSSPRFEPALELYMGQDTKGLGPVIMGKERLGIMKALRWEPGVILGLDNETADYTLRAGLEYEF